MLTDNDEIIIDPFYPCIKYKKQADPEHDGTDYFIVAESMYSNWMAIDTFTVPSMVCSLSFTCENDKKAFYKVISLSIEKECLRFRIIETL